MELDELVIKHVRGIDVKKKTCIRALILDFTVARTGRTRNNPVVFSIQDLKVVDECTWIRSGREVDAVKSGKRRVHEGHDRGCGVTKSSRHGI